MARPTVVLDLAGKHELARDLVAGGVFVPGCAVPLNEECELVVRGADEIRVAARVVFVNAAGAGLQLLCDPGLKQKIAALANPPTEDPIVELADEPAVEPADEPALDPADAPADE